MRSCCSLKTGPQAALYVMKVAESTGLRDHAAMNEKSLTGDSRQGSHHIQGHNITCVRSNVDKRPEWGLEDERWCTGAGSPGS